MDEAYTAEVEKRDHERMAEILAKLSREDAQIATELMAISFRSGVATGVRRAAKALTL